MNRDLIEQYAAAAEVPARAIAGLSPEELDAYPVPGTWSIREIIVHLMDSDLIGAERMKRVIAMDRPTLLAYDQPAFARELGYRVTDVDLACRLFALNRRFMADLLRRLPDVAFTRIGEHQERGRMTLEQLIDMYVRHIDHHLGHVRRKRELLGKPMD
jgi:uncharacterized damage-inducible protein DinB